MNEQIDNEKKLRIELKKLVTFGDYEEEVEKSYVAFTHILKKCQKSDATIDDFRMLGHISDQLQFKCMDLHMDIEKLMGVSEYHKESYTETCNEILGCKRMEDKLPGWYIDKLLVETHERIKEESNEIYNHK